MNEGSQNWSRGCCHPPKWLWRCCEHARSQVNKETGLAPESWVDMKGMNSESRGLHLPICRMLNSLTWYLIFDVQAACFLCCKLVYSLTSPSASLEQFSQSYWDAVSRAQSPKHSHQRKELSTFRLWLYFSIDKTYKVELTGCWNHWRDHRLVETLSAV